VPDSFTNRLKHAWNAFLDRDALTYSQSLGSSYGSRPDRNRLMLGTERSIISSVYTRIGIDVAAVPIRHVRLDQNGRMIEFIPSGLDNCLALEPNIDQTGRAFIQDVVISMCDEGSVAIVPVDTSFNPNISGSFDILSMRTGKIKEWYPEHVMINLYNQKSGQKEDVILPKKVVAIIENPLYSVMNEQNSTLRRLIEKLNLLDAIDQQSGSGKLDLIIQLPYVIKTQARREQAEARRKDIEAQLQGSKYGIAYTDGTEHITQLNRPAENNLMGQIEFLTSMLYSQLGLTKEIFDGNASEAAMLNYYNRTVEPILAAITDSMRRTFLTKTGRTQGQSILYLKDPFRLVPANQLAEIADKFTRNEILSSNEIRSIMGFKPSSDPAADELRNKNLNQNDTSKQPEQPDETNQNGRSSFNVEN
jgi:hypothetical protein